MNALLLAALALLNPGQQDRPWIEEVGSTSYVNEERVEISPNDVKNDPSFTKLAVQFGLPSDFFQRVQGIASYVPEGVNGKYRWGSNPNFTIAWPAVTAAESRQFPGVLYDFDWGPDRVHYFLHAQRGKSVDPRCNNFLGFNAMLILGQYPPQGPPGPPGIGQPGPKGDKGDTGGRGAKGDKGDTGECVVVQPPCPPPCVVPDVLPAYCPPPPCPQRLREQTYLAQRRETPCPKSERVVMMHPGSPGLLQTIIGGLLNVAASYVGRTQIGDTIISGLSSVSNVGNPTLSDIGNPDINITNSPRFMQRVNNSLSDIGNPTVTNWNQLQSTLQNMNVTQLKAFMQAFGGSASASASAAAAAAAAAAAGGG